MIDLRRRAWPNVSVIIVNWNGERFLGQCLDALMKQTVEPHEIVVVDNASTDRSVEIVQRFPLVRLIKQNQNAGFARGNNLALETSSEASEWIALMNPDAFAEPRWLEALLVAAESNPRFDAFGSKLVNAVDPKVLDGTGDVYHVSGLAWHSGHGCSVPALTEKQDEVFSACAAAALYRRRAMREIGGFDEDYFCYGEDVDLGFRFRLAGYRCLYVPTSVVHHVGSGTTGGENSDFAIYHGHRNLVWTFIKDMPGLLFWLFLPLHVIVNALIVIWFAVRWRRGGVLWRAKYDALMGLPSMWRKRRQIQKKRSASIYRVWRQLDKRVNITHSGRQYGLACAVVLPSWLRVVFC